MLLTAAAATAGAAQSAPAQTPPADTGPGSAVLPPNLAIDTASLEIGPFSEMSMLLEKTLFKVDILRLRVRFGPRTADSLRAVRTAEPASESDRLAAIATEARDVWAQIEFKRNVSLRQFLAGVRDDLQKAEAAGIIEPRDYQLVSNGLPRWYSFLAERGVRKGDRMFYRIVGDALRTIYVTAEGEVELDQVDVGPERRLALLGSWFAPGSSFRRKLLKSLDSVGQA